MASFLFDVIVQGGSVSHPAARHFNGLRPPFVHAGTFFDRDLRLKSGPVGPVHVFEVRKVLPDTDGKGSSDGRTKSRRLVHRRSFDGDLNDVGLSLESCQT